MTMGHLGLVLVVGSEWTLLHLFGRITLLPNCRMALSYRTVAIWGRHSYPRRTVLRLFSTSSESASSGGRLPTPPNDTSPPDFIPKPTWSIKSLDLTAKHKKLPREELERLSHLALLDIDQLPKDLEQDLANMMHMVQQVSDFVKDNPALFEEYNDPTGTVTYDFVRGVTAAPLRKATETPDLVVPSRRMQEEEVEEETQETACVWESYLEPNTVRQGGAHKYFSITTKSEESS